MSDTPGDSTPSSDDFVVLSETAKPTGETTKPDHPENEPSMSFSLVGGEGDPLSSQDQISIDPSTVLPDEDISCTTSDDISVLSISEKDDSHPKEDSSANTTPDITKREDLEPPKEGIESSKEDKDIIASEEAPMLADSPEVVVESEVDIELEVTPDVNVEDSIVTEVHATVPEVTAEVKTTTETEPDFDHKVEDKPETEVGPESQDEPEIKPYVDSSEVTTGSSDSEEPEEEIKEEKVKEVIEPAKKYNIYPLIHAVCFTLVTLHLIIPATSTDISLSPGSISVGSALLAYFLTATLIDFKILSDATFSLWMKDVFNVLVLPLVVCHIGCICYYPDLDPEMAKINQAGCIIFSILAVVECIIIRKQLDVKCIAIGLVGVATATVLSQRFSQIGEVEPLLEEDGK